MPSFSKFLKVSIVIPLKEREKLIALLDSLSVVSFEERESGHQIEIIFYQILPEDEEGMKRKIEEKLDQISVDKKTVFEVIPEHFWDEIYKNQFRKVKVGNFIIKPPWENEIIEKDLNVIVIEPGMAFGTGLHPTTQQCLLSLQEDIEQGDQLIDIGTGSGILAIAAAKIGAGKIIAVDIEKEAINLGRRNAALNNLLEKIEFYNNSWQTLLPLEVDLVVANLNGTQCLELVDKLANKRLKCRNIILSGFYIEDRIKIEGALREAGYFLLKGYERENWATVRAKGEND